MPIALRVRAPLAALALTLASLSASRPARADDYIGGMIFGVWVGGPLALIGGGGLVGAAVSDSDSGRPSTAAMTYAIGAGSLNVLWSGVLLYNAARAHDNRGLYLVPGTLDALVGVTAIAVAIYRDTRLPTKATSIQIVPTVGNDVAGRHFGGVGLRVLAL